MTRNLSIPLANTSPIIEARARSGDLAARALLENVRARLAPNVTDPDELGTVEIVLAEAINNIVEHAYAAPISADEIALRGWMTDQGLVFELTDCGKPMPDGQTPIGDRIDLNKDTSDLPEGGFGWFLIKDLAHDVHYERRENTNILTLRVAVCCNQN